MLTESSFPPEVNFSKFKMVMSFEAYIIDGETVRDIIAAMDCKTASQAYRRAKLLEILEGDANELR
jgi:hypothetical protein